MNATHRNTSPTSGTMAATEEAINATNELMAEIANDSADAVNAGNRISARKGVALALIGTIGLTGCSASTEDVMSTIGGLAIGAATYHATDGKLDSNDRNLLALTMGTMGYLVVRANLLQNTSANVGQTHDRAVSQSLQQGRTIQWEDHDHYTNRRVTGVVTPTRIGQDTRTKQTCREYHTQVMIGGKEETLVGRACRGTDGRWKQAMLENTFEFDGRTELAIATPEVPEATYQPARLGVDENPVDRLKEWLHENIMSWTFDEVWDFEDGTDVHRYTPEYAKVLHGLQEKSMVMPGDWERALAELRRGAHDETAFVGNYLRNRNDAARLVWAETTRAPWAGDEKVQVLRSIAITQLNTMDRLMQERFADPMQAWMADYAENLVSDQMVRDVWAGGKDLHERWGNPRLHKAARDVVVLEVAKATTALAMHGDLRFTDDGVQNIRVQVMENGQPMGEARSVADDDGRLMNILAMDATGEVVGSLTEKLARQYEELSPKEALEGFMGTTATNQLIAPRNFREHPVTEVEMQLERNLAETRAEAGLSAGTMNAKQLLDEVNPHWSDGILKVAKEMSRVLKDHPAMGNISGHERIIAEAKYTGVAGADAGEAAIASIHEQRSALETSVKEALRDFAKETGIADQMVKDIGYTKKDLEFNTLVEMASEMLSDAGAIVAMNPTANHGKVFHTTGSGETPMDDIRMVDRTANGGMNLDVEFRYWGKENTSLQASLREYADRMNTDMVAKTFADFKESRGISH